MIAVYFRIIQVVKIKFKKHFSSSLFQVSQPIVSLQPDEGQTVSILLSLLLSGRCLSSLIVLEYVTSQKSYLNTME